MLFWVGNIARMFQLLTFWSEFPKYNFNLLCVLLCFKVDDNGDVVSCKDILSLNTGTLSIWSWHSLHLHSPTCPTTSTSTPPSHPLPWKHLLGQTEICKPFLCYKTLFLFGVTQLLWNMMLPLICLKYESTFVCLKIKSFVFF